METETLIDLEQLQKVLQEYAKEAEEIYKYQISLGGHNASRKLIDTIKTRIDYNDQSYEVAMTLNKYWKYIEGGRKGKDSSPPGAVYKAAFPPVNALMEWISVKPVLPREFDGKRSPRPKSLAFLIGRKIEQEGIEPYPAMATTIEECNKIYREKLSEALGHDVFNYIRKIITTK
jgi:hypothetical protein